MPSVMKGSSFVDAEASSFGLADWDVTADNTNAGKMALAMIASAGEVHFGDVTATEVVIHLDESFGYVAFHQIGTRVKLSGMGHCFVLCKSCIERRMQPRTLNPEG